MFRGLEQDLAERGYHAVHVEPLSRQHGAEVFKVDLKDRRAIIKRGARRAIMSEAWGLNKLDTVKGVSTPGVFDSWTREDYGLILMEFIPSRQAQDQDLRRLGEMVASLHRATASYFGAEMDNFIGSLDQDNTAMDRWPDFWWEKRILPQLILAASRGFDFFSAYPDIERTIRSSHIVREVRKGSLLHGDLWNGNFLIHEDGRPYLLDPCPYYGDPRVDLAMTRLFGGFRPTFYQAYTHNSDPELDFNEEVCQFYQLYFLLNHLNMFGTGYLGGVKTCLNGLR
jgi:fructosamine-3-kinase